VKAVVRNVEACQRNVNMEETVLQLCATLLVTSIHCTTASVMLIIMSKCIQKNLLWKILTTVSLLVIWTHCTTESVKEHHIIAFITNIYDITNAYKNVRCILKLVLYSVDNFFCCIWLVMSSCVICHIKIHFFKVPCFVVCCVHV
jgi:hypothetical protein